MSNHFGFALGAITVSVIGGAIVLDHFTSKDEPAVQAAASSVPAKPEIVAEASTTVSDAGKEQPMPSPSVASAPPEPAKLNVPPKKSAPSAPAAHRR